MKILYRAGDRLLFTRGEYADFSIAGEYVALKGFNLRTALRRWHFNACNAEPDRQEPDPDGFVTYLVSSKLIRLVDEDPSIHLGEYRRLSRELSRLLA